MLHTGQFSDFKISVGAETYTVHKIILASHSSVFAAQFRHETEDAKTNIVVWEDVSAEAAKAFLEYLYSGDIPDSILGKLKLAPELIGLSEKFDIPNLMKICVTKANVCQLLPLTDMYQSGRLVEACKKVVSENKKEICQSEDWKNLKKKHLVLVVNLLEQLFLA
jgi:hypothetical protein